MMASVINGAGSVSVQAALLCTCVSLVLGLVIAAVYMLQGEYTKNFVVTLLLLPALVQAVIMLVNGNLGTGVAIMGAFSLVRFRSVPSFSVNFRSFLDFGTASQASILTTLKSDLLNVSKSTSSANKGSIFTLERSICTLGADTVAASAEPFTAAFSALFSARFGSRVFIVGSFFAPAVKSCKMIYISLNHYNIFFSKLY